MFRFPLAVIFSISFFLFLFISCANEVPEFTEVSSIVIFDYESDDSLNVRMSIFASTTEDVERTLSFSAFHIETGLDWEVYSPTKIKNEGESGYFGYTNLVAPGGEFIPTGNYLLTYKDLQGKSTEANFFIEYPQELLNARIIDFPGILNGLYKEYYALYDKEKKLIYYSEKKSEWTSPKEIRHTNPLASYYRICYLSIDNAFVCLMPLKQIYKDG